MLEGAADHLIYILADKDPICPALALQPRNRSVWCVVPWPLSQHAFREHKWAGRPLPLWFVLLLPDVQFYLNFDTQGRTGEGKGEMIEMI